MNEKEPHKYNKRNFYYYFFPTLILLKMLKKGGKDKKSDEGKNNGKSKKNAAGKKTEGKSEDNNSNKAVKKSELPLKKQNSTNKAKGTGAKDEPPMKKDSIDDDDVSVTISVDDVDMKDGKKESGKGKKKNKSPIKRKESPGINNLVGGAYLELAHDYHDVFERKGRHHKGFSTLCCQCFCYVIFLVFYLGTIFYGNESSKSFFFQQHVRDTFSLHAPPGQSSSASNNINFGNDGTLENIGIFVNNYILSNPRISYVNVIPAASPISASLLPDNMIVILGKVLIREYDVEYTEQSLSNDYSVCQVSDLKSHYEEQCATFKSTSNSIKTSTDGIDSVIKFSVGAYGYSGDWYEGNKATRATLLTLENTDKLEQWNNEIFNKFTNGTKFILFEMNFLSGHTLQFGSLRLGFEKTSSGNIKSTQKFVAENLYNFRNPINLLSSNVISLQAQLRMTEFILVVLSTIYLFPAIINWLTYGTRAYLGKIWNILPLINCVFFITILVFKILIGDRIELILNRVRADTGISSTFDDIYTAIYLIKYMKAINGINAIVLILNIFRYFEAHQKLAIFITGVQHALWDMFLFLPTVLGFTILAYAVAFHLSFGDRITNFKNISSSYYSLVTLLVGNSDGFSEIYDESWQIGISLYISYIVLVIIILGTTFFSVVDAAYHHAKGKKEFGDDIDFLSEDFADTFYILTICCTCPCRKLEKCCQASVGKVLRKVRKIKLPHDEINANNNNNNGNKTDSKPGSKQDTMSKLSKISQVFPMKGKGRYNNNPKRSGIGGKGQMEVLFARMLHQTGIQNKHLLHEIHELFEHYGTGLGYHSGDESTIGTSELSEDDIEDFQDEFSGHNLKSEGHAGRRKELKRHRAGESETKRGPHKKKIHEQDDEYEDYDVVTHDDEHV